MYEHLCVKPKEQQKKSWILYNKQQEIVGNQRRVCANSPGQVGISLKESSEHLVEF